MSLTTKPSNQATESPNFETGAIIAPGEIRELIARLTEQSVEAVPAHESRTLEALAIETGIPMPQLRQGLADLRQPKRRLFVPPPAIAGFIALIGIGYWSVIHTPPVNPTTQTQVDPPSMVNPVVPPVEAVDLTDTVPLSMVTFGPDAGDYAADRNFEPSVSLPEGLSVNVQGKKMIWGYGDHRATALDRPLTPGQEKAVRTVMEELLRYVRSDGPRRHAVTPDPKGFSPFQLGGQSYHGSYGSSVNLPPPGKEYDAQAERAIRSAAKSFVDHLQEQLRETRRWQRELGP